MTLTLREGQTLIELGDFSCAFLDEVPSRYWYCGTDFHVRTPQRLRWRPFEQWLRQPESQRGWVLDLPEELRFPDSDHLLYLRENFANNNRLVVVRQHSQGYFFEDLRHNPDELVERRVEAELQKLPRMNEGGLAYLPPPR